MLTARLFNQALNDPGVNTSRMIGERMYFCTRLVLLLVRVFSVTACGNEYRGLTFEESIAGVSEECPQWILDNQVLIDVVHWGFDGELHRGQIVADARLQGELQLVFLLMLLTGFPMESVEPISLLDWDDFESMRRNNTSAFNYREVPGSDRLSKHAYGQAIDINPCQNPYFSHGQVFPEGEEYDPSVPGTLYDGHPVVELFRLLGWRWGGDWLEKDYHHFDKLLDERELSGVNHHRSWPLWRLI